MPRLQLACCLRDLGTRIFNILRFIKNHEMEILELKFFNIAMQQGEGRENHIGIRHAAEILRAIRTTEH